MEESLVLVPNNLCPFFYVLVDCTSFRKTFDIAGIKSFDCQFSNFEMEISEKFYAGLSLFLCMVPTLYLFLHQSLKNSSNFFSSVTCSSCIFHSANHDADRCTLVHFWFEYCTGLGAFARIASKHPPCTPGCWNPFLAWGGSFDLTITRD